MSKRTPSKPGRSLPSDSLGLPVVAILGRPNVGKSTLFNRLARQKLAIVYDEPGVTRDRHYAMTTAFGRDYALIDTGGFDPESDDPMRTGINAHVKSAITEADAIIFITDGTEPLDAADRAAVDLLRRSKVPVFYAANKIDSPASFSDAFELYRHGIKKVYAISAQHGRGVGELEADVLKVLPPPREEAFDDDALKVTVVGRPNAGKSSLINRLAGEDRLLVDSRPGTTRDSIDVVVKRADKTYVFCDTAGLRKKGRVTKGEDPIERESVMSSVRGIERSQITILLCDIAEGVAEQDAKILGLAEDRGRGLIIALNKTDLVDAKKIERAKTLAREKLSFAPYAQIITISAKTGRGIGGLFDAIESVHTEFNKRITTGALNRFFAQVLEHRSPPTQGGKAPRVFFVTQVETAPPLFVVMAKHAASLHFSYQRYVQNQLRKHFGFEGVPVRISYREKTGREKGGAAASDEVEEKKPAQRARSRRAREEQRHTARVITKPPAKGKQLETD